MKLNELKDKLYDLSPKARLCLNEKDFSETFPPGRTDYDAMIRAAKFAHENGCEVKANKQICFVKKNPNSRCAVVSRSITRGSRSTNF
jgi:hypothetical protein